MPHSFSYTTCPHCDGTGLEHPRAQVSCRWCAGTGRVIGGVVVKKPPAPVVRAALHNAKRKTNS